MAVLSLLNPFGWFGSSPAKLSGGSQATGSGWGSTYANRPVTPQSALQLSAYSACVRLNGQTVGTLPLRLYEKQADGSRREAIENDLYDVLQNQPNADHTGVEFWEGVAACLSIWGNSYALKTMTSDGRLVALDLLRPFWMEVLRDHSGALIYRYRDPNASIVDYGAADIFHVRGFGFCEIVGLAPIDIGRQTIASATAAEEAAGRLFSNGMKVGGWFRYKGGNGVLTKEQQADTRAALIEPYQGAENTGKTGILPGDFDWISTSMNAIDAELMATRRMNVEEICRNFGIPPIMIGHAAQGQTMWGSGVENIMLSYMTMGLRPNLHRIEAAIGRDIIGRTGRRTLAAEFDVEVLLRGDTKTQTENEVSLANNGIKSRNEIRRVRNLPPIEGGNSLTVQGALIPVDMLGKIAKLPAEKQLVDGADVRTEVKFNPDQPRDDRGRFSSGGSANPSALSEPLTTREKTVLGVVGAGVTALAVGALLHRKVPYRSFGSSYLDQRYRSLDIRSALYDLHAKSVYTPIADHEKAAVVKYTTSAYAAINKKLRLGHKPSPDVENIDAALNKSMLAENTVLYRGLNLDRSKRLLKSTNPGDSFVDRGFPSTSLSEEVARTFAGSRAGAGTGHVANPDKHGYVLSINVDKGANALPLTAGYTAHDMLGVHEVLLPRSSAFKMLRVDHDTKTIYTQHLGVASAGKAAGEAKAISAPIWDLGERFVTSDDDLEFYDAPDGDTTAADYADYVPPQPSDEAFKAFDPSQPRNEDGEWSDGGSGSSSLAEAKHQAILVAKGAAVLAGAALAIALAPEIAAGAVAATGGVLATGLAEAGVAFVAREATKAADTMLASAAYQAGLSIARSAGYDTSKVEGALNPLLQAYGVQGKSSSAIDEPFRQALIDVVDHSRLEMIDGLRSHDLEAKAMNVAEDAIYKSSVSIKDKLAAI